MPYNEKSDLWSIGVIIYILLCGTPPFQGKTDDEIFQKIKNGQIFLEGERNNSENNNWNFISDSAKDLIKKLLTVNTSERISANDAYAHPWI